MKKLGQHRTIRQADSARDFSPSQGLKSAGILYVFQTFQTAELAEKIRRSAQTQLRGAALGSLVLALALLLALAPAALAADTAWDGSVDISWYDPAAPEYYISTPAQLAGLAALVSGMADPAAPRIVGDTRYLQSVRTDNVRLVGAGGGNVTDSVYTSQIDFAYKTVYLTADLDMGGVYNAASGTWSGPNWTPIGGKYPMKPDEVAGDCLTLDTRFHGVLDGQGHTISNLYCDRYAAKGFPYSMAVGLVGFLGGTSGNDHGGLAEFTDGWQPAVRNLVLASGFVYARRMVGGIVGRMGDTSDGVLIENCANRASIRSTDAKGVGGIVGAAWGAGMIRNCYNTGSVSTTYTCPAGGILGSNGGMDVYNCYSTGTIDTHGVSYGRGIGGHDSGAYTVENCYYLAGSDDDARSGGYYKGVSRQISVSVTALSAEAMKSAAFVSRLNANGGAFAADTANRSGGYPVLRFETAAAKTACAVTLAPCEHGAVTVRQGASVAAGTTVDLTAQPESGWTLDYFTVDGQPIDGSFYTVTASCTVGAVFQRLRTAALTVAPAEGFYLAVRRTGWRVDDGGAMTYVTNEPVYTGDTLYEGNALTLLTQEYEHAAPKDSGLEYRSGVTFTVTGAEATLGSYTVTGSGAVTVAGTRNTQEKSWASCADTGWYAGKQTVYTLTTAEQLAGLAALVSGGTDFAGVTVRLGADISLAGDTKTGAPRVWMPIGTSIRRAFRGTFDAQSHKITGLRAHNTGSNSALFGCAVDAVLQNLTLCGTAAGEASASYAAGLIAYASGCTIRNCAVYVDVTAAGTHAGGVAAYITGGTTLKNCTSYGAVRGTSGVGGLAGVCYSGEDKVEGCANFGDVTSTASGTYGTGGLVGRLAGTLTESANYGTVVSADRYTGGLAGYTTARNKTAVTLCRSDTDVRAGSTDSRAAAGALIGYAQNLIWGGCETENTTLPAIGTRGNVRETAASGAIPAFSAAPRPEDVPAPAAQAAQTDGAQKHFVEKNAVTRSGVYDLPYFATGTVTIADGLDVTLIGACGPFEDLTLAVGKNTKLTLQDVAVTGDRTLLTLAGGNTLTLAGKNSLTGTSDASENAQPTVRISGDLTVDGAGSLSVTAQQNNAAALAAPGAAVRQRGGTLSVYKTGSLSTTDGAFSAEGASFELSGGTFCGRTDSDNVAVLAADTVAVTGGELRAAAEQSPAAVRGSVTLTGCTVTAQGRGTENAAAIASVKSQSGVTWKPLLPYADVGAESLSYADVRTCRERGWLRGTASGKFSPDASMTRAMFVTALYRLAGQPAAAGETPFTDLTAAWYQSAVRWASTTGVAAGVSKTRFAPDAALSVEQAAVLLCRYAGGTASADLPAGCGKVSDWALDAVRWAYGAGILTASDLAAPAQSASRALLAQMLARFAALNA